MRSYKRKLLDQIYFFQRNVRKVIEFGFWPVKIIDQLIVPEAKVGIYEASGANAYGDNNTSGASFRIVVDTEDWEKTIGINNPGQSGNPESPFYKNLFPIWANDEFVSIPFSREKIQMLKASEERLVPYR